MATTLTARTPEDILAMVPVVLGFHPADSVVMLTFGAEHTFHARVDMPPTIGGVEDMVNALLEPSIKNGIRRVVFVTYSMKIPLLAIAALRNRFREAGIEVLETLHTDGSRWWAMTSPSHFSGEGTAYDLSGHPFALQAMFDDRTVEADRAALVARLEPVDAVFGGTLPLVNEDDLTWAGVMFTECRPLDADETAAFVACLHKSRDVALRHWSKDRVQEQTDWLIEVARRTPAEHRSVVLMVASMGAWLSGHGALAWCCLDAAPNPEACSLGLSMQVALTEAVPPSSWWEAQA